MDLDPRHGRSLDYREASPLPGFPGATHFPETSTSMKSFAFRLSALVMALVAIAVLAGAASKGHKGAANTPDTLIILSTTDVKGKTSPCG